MASRVVIPLAVIALTAAACSSGDRAADPTTPTPTPTGPATAATPTTSVPATTTTLAPTTTVALTTTVPPITVPPTTVLPTTPTPTAPIVSASTLPLPTPDGFTLEEVQVIDRDFREGYRRLLVALGDITDEAAVKAALEYTTGDETANVLSIVENYRTRNRRLERLPAPLESFEILQGPTVLVNGDVRLSLCHVAPYRGVEESPDPDAAEVETGSVFTQRIAVDLRFEDGVWKRSTSYFQGQWDGVVRCQDMP